MPRHPEPPTKQIQKVSLIQKIINWLKGKKNNQNDETK